MQKKSAAPVLSVVMPVFNGGDVFRTCLTAALASLPENCQFIVVDDCSTDHSRAIALEKSVVVLQLPGRSGPAVARNAGALAAQGDILCFLDADCEVHEDTFQRILDGFRADNDVDAVFGSYDDDPASPRFVAQYKNLMHHFVHHRGNRNASTFWAGCGAIRRGLFETVGGFDEGKYRRPSIEDIELGGRLRQRGAHIVLDPEIQVRHHKAWTLRSMVVTDFRDRALPWTELILSGGGVPNDLNLQYRDRASAIAVWLMILAVAFAFLVPALLLIAGILGVGLLFLNRDVYGFLRRKRGFWFAAKSVPLHWLYFAYSLAAFGIGGLLYIRGRFARSLRT